MLKLSAKIAPFFYMIAVLALASCGGQAVKPEEEAAVVIETPVVVEEPVAEVVPEPVVEVMPQKQMDEPQIAVEPIPPVKDDIAAAAEEVMPEVAASAEKAATPVVAEKVVEPTDVAQEAVVAPAVAAPKAKTSTVPTSTGPNHFVITVGPKETSHPAYGKGHSMGFLVNGVSGKELVVERNKLYTFEIATNPKHDVYLSKKAIGWGGAPFAKGVEGAYTYKGKMTLKADKETPDQLFYACRNHPYMGGVIHIVDKGQKVDIKQQTAASKAAGGAVSAKAVTVTQSKVKQKLMFAEMMAGAAGTKRVLASQNDEAKQLVAAAKKKLAAGREKSLVGALPAALALANESLKMLSEASRLVPSDDELAQLAENYKNTLGEIQGYQKSYRDNIKRMEKKGAVPDDVRMDEKKLAATLTKAKALAEKKNYVRANKLLQQAQASITGALHKMLDSTTIVYDLKFDTAADEYEYELKRFTGYEELIPVAIEAKKPAAGAIKLMESFLSKARSRRDEAIAKADAGDYPTAIAMLIQATKTVRRALRMVGVSQ
jgi:hypothetical protein